MGDSGRRCRNCSGCWSAICDGVDALYDRDNEPTYDASGFYRKLGFDYAAPHESLPPETPYRTMYCDLKPIIDLVEAAKPESI